MYAKADKEEETRCSSCRQESEIIAEYKEKVAEVHRPASKNMTEKMAEMEEKTTEVRRVTRHKMDDMEKKASDIAR